MKLGIEELWGARDANAVLYCGCQAAQGSKKSLGTKGKPDHEGRPRLAVRRSTWTTPCSLAQLWWRKLLAGRTGRGTKEEVLCVPSLKQLEHTQL